MKTWKIYKHTLITDCDRKGKSYIGMTGQNVKKRWQNSYGYIPYSNSLFAVAIKKYGWNNFSHEILEENLTFEECCTREKYWIQYYHTYTNDPLCWGYNLTTGGEGVLGRTVSTETRKKISDAHKGKKLSEYHKQQISKGIIGEHNPFYGKHHSEETKELIRRANLGRHLSEETKEIIRQKSTGRVVSEETRKKLSEINKGKPKSEEQRKHLSESRTGYKYSKEAKANMGMAHNKPIICIETCEEFFSILNASEKLKINRSYLNQHLKGKYPSVKGLHFKYKEKK